MNENLKRDNIRMKKCKGIIICIMIGLLFAGCGKKEMTVGSVVKTEDINEFYYTVDESTYPPQFFRYYFHKENGQWMFHFEKREADHWPLREDDVTESCDISLSDEERDEFFSYIENGKITKRSDEPLDSSGPYLFIYWNGDKGDSQVYHFENYGKQKNFESFCSSLIR